MSLSQNINNYIDETVRKYIKTISTTYNLDYDLLMKEWNGETTVVKQTPQVKGVVESKKSECKNESKSDSKVESTSRVETTKVVVDDTESLMKLTKQELQERCKKAGVRSSGTKNDLVKYLLENKTQTKIKTPPLIARLEEKEQETKKMVLNPIVRKITSSIPVLNIRRNKFNNYEDINTGFVFNNLTKKVIGKQSENGAILELTKEDINICNKYKFTYELPSNLDKNTRVDDVKVEELDEEEEDIAEEEIEGEAEGEVEQEGELDIEDEEDDDIEEDEELVEEEEVLEEDE